MKNTNIKDSAAKKEAPVRDVDDYLAAVPAEVRNMLEKLRAAIKTAAPDAEEVVSYRIPTYKYHGALVHFVARENYCSFVVASKRVVDALSSKLKNFDVSGTTIHFTVDNPLGVSLVKNIVAARVKENEAKAKR